MSQHGHGSKLLFLHKIEMLSKVSSRRMKQSRLLIMTILPPFQRHWLSFSHSWWQRIKDTKVSWHQMTYSVKPDLTTSKGSSFISLISRITNGKRNNLQRNSPTNLSTALIQHLVQNNSKMSTMIMVKTILTMLMIFRSIKYSKSPNTLTIKTTTTNRSKSNPKNILKLRTRKISKDISPILSTYTPMRLSYSSRKEKPTKDWKRRLKSKRRNAKRLH